MKAEAVTALVTGLKQAGINFIASLPSRALGPAIYTIMNDADFIHVPVANLVMSISPPLHAIQNRPIID